ncbi:hypothetical protein PAHAL_2G032100 [Panicum hallii]|jgi:hypothetical protein|uniref:LOB domain-containing protein n=1 Tax=Panicum hallii TaxID=206008 RepID=A0A2S3GVL3_9POAL|nr:uncharacterized protein LOC112882549 [Panicum hallii]PAN09538.1 hypothetical protein PAHAL_2G032100 [Panicum hallii]
MPEDEVEVVSWTAAAQPAAQVPCGACRTLRRRCVPGCVFAPYFPAEGDEPSRFAAVHRVFGASNAVRMLEDVERPGERRRAAETLVEEALARVRDPALGCLSYVAVLQMLNEKAREQVDAVRAEIAAEFGPEAASEPVDIQAAGPEVELEAKAQAERALAHAREQDAKMLAARRAVDRKWRQLRQAARRAAGERLRLPGGRWQDTNNQMAETENTAAAAAAGESSSEQTMLTPQAAAVTELDSPEGNGHPQESAPAAGANQHRHLASQHAGAEQGIPEGYGHGQLHQLMAETQQSTAGAEASREEALTSEQAPAAALQHHDSATTQLDGTGTSFLDRHQVAAAGELSKKLDTMIRRFAAAQQYDDPAAARYAWMGPDVSPRLQQPPQPEDTVPQVAEARQEAATAEVASDQDLMMMLVPQIAEAEAAAEQDVMMQLLAAGAPQYDDLASQYDDDTEVDITLGYGHRDMYQQTVQQLAAAAKVAREQGIMAHIATAELSREQEMIVRQASQPEMTILLQAAAAQYSDTELDIWLGQGHPYRHQPTVQELETNTTTVQQLEPSTTTVQQVGGYMDGEHGSDSGVTVAFQLPGSAEAAPFLVEQEPPPQGQTASALGLEVDSSLPPLPPSLGGPHGQQSTDGGDEDQCSDLTEYLFY